MLMGSTSGHQLLSQPQRHEIQHDVYATHELQSWLGTRHGLCAANKEVTWDAHT